LQKSGDGDFLRAATEAVLQMMMKADVEGAIGAGTAQYLARFRSTDLIVAVMIERNDNDVIDAELNNLIQRPPGPISSHTPVLTGVRTAPRRSSTT
jgi:hypothetical protein